MSSAFEDDPILAESASLDMSRRKSGNLAAQDSSTFSRRTSKDRRSRAQSLHDAVQAFKSLAEDDEDGDGAAIPVTSSVPGSPSADHQNSVSTDALEPAASFGRKISSSADLSNNAGAALRRATAAVTNAQNDAWMHQWVAAATRQDENLTVSTGRLEFNRHVFGPPIEAELTDTEKCAEEVRDILLHTEADYNDAIAFADRANFLSEPFDATRRHVTSAMAVAANGYAMLRELFQSFDFEFAMQRMSTYTAMMRVMRSVVYLAESIQQSSDQVESQSRQLVAMKAKYEGTIKTLRRQLADFHGELSSVGRGVDGKFELQKKGHAEAVAAAAAAVPGTFIVLVQLEEATMFKRKPGFLKEILRLAKGAITMAAPTYRCSRTNFFEEEDAAEEVGTSSTVSRCLLFTAERSYDAVAFALMVHAVLHTQCEWPSALMSTKKYSLDLWRGLRARVGVHFGELSEMELDNTSRVKHYEGPAVEKVIRVAGLANAGDVCMTHEVAERLQACSVAGELPTKGEYNILRGVEQIKQPAPPRYGFRKADFLVRMWSTELATRLQEPVEADYTLPTFYQLEAAVDEHDTAYDDDGAPPSTDELLAAKDSEIAVLQQELDNLRLAVMKRDTDIVELRQKLYFMLAKVEERSKIKEVILTETVRCLETNLMGAHDTLSALEHVAQLQPPVASIDGAASSFADGDASTALPLDGTTRSRTESTGGLTLDIAGALEGGSATPRSASEVNTRTPRSGRTWTVSPNHSNASSAANGRWRKLLSEAGVVSAEEKVNAFIKETEDRKEAAKQRKRDKIIAEMTGETLTPEPEEHKPLKRKSSGRHRNTRLWRELMEMVESTAVPTVTITGPEKSGSGVFGSSGLGGSSPMLRTHSIVKVFNTLLKRFAAEDDRPDAVDNRGISEDQFMKLYVMKAHADQLTRASSERSGAEEGWKMASSRDQLSWLAALAIDSDDVEIANRFDDARLARSIAGHLAAVFHCVRNLKRAHLVAAQQLHQTQQQAQSDGHGGGTGKTAGGGGAKGAAAGRRRSRTISAVASAAVSRVASKSGRGGGGDAGHTPTQSSLAPPSADAPMEEKKVIELLNDEVRRLQSELATAQKAGQTQTLQATSSTASRRRSTSVMIHENPVGGRSRRGSLVGASRDAAAAAANKTPKSSSLAPTSTATPGGGKATPGASATATPNDTGLLVTVPSGATQSPSTGLVLDPGDAKASDPFHVPEFDPNAAAQEQPTSAAMAADDPVIPTVDPAAAVGSPTTASSPTHLGPGAALSPGDNPQSPSSGGKRRLSDASSRRGSGGADVVPPNLSTTNRTVREAARPTSPQRQVLKPAIHSYGLAIGVPSALTANDSLKLPAAGSAARVVGGVRAARGLPGSAAQPASTTAPGVRPGSRAQQQRANAATPVASTVSPTLGLPGSEPPKKAAAAPSAPRSFLQEFVPDAVEARNRMSSSSTAAVAPAKLGRVSLGVSGSTTATAAGTAASPKTTLTHEGTPPAPAGGGVPQQHALPTGVLTPALAPQQHPVMTTAATTTGSSSPQPLPTHASENLALALLLRPNAVSAPPAVSQQRAAQAVDHAPLPPSEVARRERQSALESQLAEVRKMQQTMAPPPGNNNNTLASSSGAGSGGGARPASRGVGGGARGGVHTPAGGHRMSGATNRAGSSSLQRADSKRSTFAVVRSVQLQTRSS